MEEQAQISTKTSQDNLNNTTSQHEETIDSDFNLRCKDYLMGYKCHKGSFCNKMHKLPREDKILCKYWNIKGSGCPRKPQECWFWHPNEHFEYVPDINAPVIVQSMAETLKYISRKLKNKARKEKQVMKTYNLRSASKMNKIN